jgi:RNA polymerase sigma-70 factor (ECF subfamily)
MSIFGNNLKEMYPDIRRVAMKLTKYNYADADDLVQKTLLKAFEKQGLYKSGNLTGWVVTIMKNLFIDDMRKLKDKIFVDIEDEVLVSNDDDKYLDVADTNSALKRLSERCQNILLLIAEEYKYTEISEQLSIPIGTVMSGLTRCRKQLYKELYG